MLLRAPHAVLLHALWDVQCAFTSRNPSYSIPTHFLRGYRLILWFPSGSNRCFALPVLTLGFAFSQRLYSVFRSPGVSARFCDPPATALGFSLPGINARLGDTPATVLGFSFPRRFHSVLRSTGDCTRLFAPPVFPLGFAIPR